MLRQALWQFMAPVSQVTKQPVSVDDGRELLSELGNGANGVVWQAAVPNGTVALLAITSTTNKRLMPFAPLSIISCTLGTKRTQSARTRAYIRHRVLAPVPLGQPNTLNSFSQPKRCC
jgi:hypothetical protein